MKLIRTEEAVGHVLCHDMTQIIKDQIPVIALPNMGQINERMLHSFFLLM